MLPPGLSMLWEEVDPDEALRTRFGFDGYAAVVAWMTALLDEVWSVALLDGHRVTISGPNVIAWTTTDRGALIMKWSCAGDRFEALERSTVLLHQLASRAIPVAEPLPSKHGRVRIVHDGPRGPLSVAVLPELVADWLDVSDPEAVRAAGASLARLQQALCELSGDHVRPAPGTGAWTDQVADWLATDDHPWAPAATARLAGMVSGLPPLPDDLQLAHSDFRAANLLTRQSVITGILDFDDLRWDYRINELARASVYLGTLFRDWRPTPEAARAEFRAGYESVRSFAPYEAEWFDALALWYAIRAIPTMPDTAAWEAAVR